LFKKYPEIKDKFKRFIRIDNIEIIPFSCSLIKNFQKVISRADKIGGFKFVSLEDLIVWKKKMDRPKDFKDIKLIKNYSKNKKRH
jgi:predicted nucleotidyltransferase